MQDQERKTTSAPPSGFTLLELLIVLSIMAAIAIMAWPRILPALARSVPRTAALQLKRDLAEAREEAIRTGETWVFRYQVDSPLYQIAPASWQENAEGSQVDLPKSSSQGNEIGRKAPLEQGPLDAANDQAESQSTQAISEKPLTTAPHQARNRHSDEAKARHYESRELPGDVVFIEPAPPWEEGMELRTEEELRKEEGELLVAEDAQLTLTLDAPLVEQVPWIVGSEFYSDGRARDCELELHPRDSKHFIRVHLRGFTGALAIGPVEQKEEIHAKSSDGTVESPSESGLKDAPNSRDTEPSNTETTVPPLRESRGKS